MSPTFWIGPVVCMVEQALAARDNVIDWWTCHESAFEYGEMLDCYLAYNLDTVDTVLGYFDCAAGLFV
jgi:hypothetical protein